MKGFGERFTFVKTCISLGGLLLGILAAMEGTGEDDTEDGAFLDLTLSSEYFFGGGGLKHNVL